MNSKLKSLEASGSSKIPPSLEKFKNELDDIYNETRA